MHWVHSITKVMARWSRRDHHDVTPTRPEQIEDAAEGQPAFYYGLGARLAAHRGNVLAQIGDAVGQHQVGLEGELREARPHRGHRAEGAGQHLAVAAERLRDRDGAPAGAV